jgi:hypothetical protein
VGEDCYYYTNGEWRLCRRIEDDFDGDQRFARRDDPARSIYCGPDYDGIRPLGSLPVPASVREKAEVTTPADPFERFAAEIMEQPDREPTILATPPDGSAK